MPVLKQESRNTDSPATAIPDSISSQKLDQAQLRLAYAVEKAPAHARCNYAEGLPLGMEPLIALEQLR
jgi:hypothetical protein